MTRSSSETPQSRAAYARGQHWMKAVGACIAQLDPVPRGANIGFVYLGRELGAFTDLITSSLREATGVRTWVGATGRAALGPGCGEVPEGGLAVLVTTLAERSFWLLESVADRVGRGSAAILHAETGAIGLSARLAELAMRTEAFLIGVSSAAGSGLPQVAGAVGEGVVSGVVLGNALAVLPLVVRGCVQLGPTCRVTSRIGPEVYALDGRPALDLVLERLGDIARARPERALEEILLGRPDHREGRPRPVARVVAFDLGRRSLTLEPSELAGAEIALFRRDPPTAERRLREALGSVRETLAGRRPTAVLYFTAARRLAKLGSTGIQEVELMLDALGRPPLVGLASDAVIIEDRIEPAAAVAAVLA